VRVVLNDSGEVIQSNDYYPFGMLMAQGGSSTNKYLYNGKEAQEQTGWLDYGWRMYDNSLGRWHGVDKLSESMPFVSPYTYALNNSIKLRDAFGLHPEGAVEGIVLPEVTVFGDRIRYFSFLMSKYYHTSRSGENSDVDWYGLTRQLSTLGDDALRESALWFQSLKPTLDPIINYVFSPVDLGINSWVALHYSRSLTFGNKVLLDGYWRSGGGRYYSFSVLNRMPNGKYVRGVQGLRYSLNWAKTSVKIPSVLGKGVGGLTVLYSGINVVDGFGLNWDTLFDSIDFGIGVIGAVYWPVGVVYTVGRIFVGGMINYHQMMQKQGLRPGVDDWVIWKY